MAVGLKPIGDLIPVPGFRLGSVKAGIRYPDRRDLVIMTWPENTSVAGVFTRNHFCAAPITLTKERMSQRPVALIVNTGYANAGTGDQGLQDACRYTSYLSNLLGCGENQVLPFSTGVIGELLPVDRVERGLPGCVDSLDEGGWVLAAEGIMTTDTQPKGLSRQFEFQGRVYTVTGIAKGSGMIRPDMATMLAYIATDAAVEQECLQRMMSRAAGRSFNRITIDSDTSTNDACLLFATGMAQNKPVSNETDGLYKPLYSAIESLCRDLAQLLVRDGEGATKFVAIECKDAASVDDALAVAYTVAHSPLVKTALFASDPNWGRILAAVGRSPVSELHIDKVSIWLDNVCIVSNGGLASGYREADGQAVMDQNEFSIRISLGNGSCVETVWTSDLSHEYVKINAEYRS